MQLCLLLPSLGKERGSPRLRRPTLGYAWESVAMNRRDYVSPINQKVGCPGDQTIKRCTAGNLSEIKGRGLRSLQFSSSSSSCGGWTRDPVVITGVKRLPAVWTGLQISCQELSQWQGHNDTMTICRLGPWCLLHSHPLRTVISSLSPMDLSYDAKKW